VLLVAEIAAAAPPLTSAPAAVQSVRERVDRARELLGRGDTTSAVRSLREALNLDPHDAEARALLGFALIGMGDLDGAIEELRATTRLHPDFTPARLHLATALMARQDMAGARTELDEVLRRQTDHVQARYSLGIVRYALGDLPGAVESYRQVLAVDPGHHDARFYLALTLKLAHREADATREFLVAAEAGLPRAQYFAGMAYSTGLGVEKNLVAAITWWLLAAERGVPAAEEALAQMRRVALGRVRVGTAERQAADEAFRAFREGLRGQFSDVTVPTDDSVGSALIARNAPEGLPMLLREAAALSEPAQRRLVEVYERGVDGYLAAYDARILAWLRSAAAEGQVRPRIWLARVYASGLGVPKDVPRALALLRSTPHEDAQRLLQELSTVRSD
jgi:TPR repeat protein